METGGSISLLLSIHSTNEKDPDLSRSSGPRLRTNTDKYSEKNNKTVMFEFESEEEESIQHGFVSRVGGF